MPVLLILAQAFINQQYSIHSKNLDFLDHTKTAGEMFWTTKLRQKNYWYVVTVYKCESMLKTSIQIIPELFNQLNEASSVFQKFNVASKNLDHPIESPWFRLQFRTYLSCCPILHYHKFTEYSINLFCYNMNGLLGIHLWKIFYSKLYLQVALNGKVTVAFKNVDFVFHFSIPFMVQNISFLLLQNHLFLPFLTNLQCHTQTSCM